MKHYLAPWKKYVTFSGRAQRAEYWTFVLVNAVILMTLVGIGQEIHYVITNLAILFGLAVLLPSIAVSVRRLHDTGRSGWWLFFKLIPFVGDIVLLVFTLFDSQPGQNKFGPNPKGVSSPIPTVPTV